jgi:hypothetical protein
MINNDKLDAAIEKQSIIRNEKKASRIKGNRIWDIAARNNLKPRVVKIKRLNGTVEYLKG